MANFLWGSAGQKMSPAQVAEQRKIAQALMAEGSDTSPVGHWTAALNRGLQGYLGGRQAYQAREAENAGRAGLEAKRAGQANAATFGGADPVAAALSGGAGFGNYAVPAGGDVATSLFPASLIETESGGNWNALNNEGYGGRLQFGAARLADAANAGVIPAGIDGAAFSRLPPEQQMAVENWHFQDIENQARRMGLDQYVGQTVAGVPIDMNAIKGMAHLGGIGGAAKFLQSGGQYNPADSNGTSLAAYGRRHGGGSAPAQGGGMSNIAELLADEWLPESERAVLQAQYESQLKQQDPMYQAQYEGQVLANQAARQPKPAAAPDTQVFFDEATGQDYRAQWNPNTMSWDRVGGVKAPSGPLVNVDMGGSPGLGKLSTDFGYVLDEAGNPRIDPATGLPQAAPVPGSPAALALEKEKEGKDKRETSSANTANIVLQDIDKAINQTGWSTSGLGGAILGKLPGSGATDLRATTDTIKANIGFDRLQQMRESSPTGGALGGIAVQELAMLQAVLGSLDQAQGPEQLRANLQRLKEIYEPIAAKAAAYPNAAQFGFDGTKSPESGAPAPSSQPKRLRYNQQTGAFE